MHKVLIISAFEKAREEAMERGEQNPSLQTLAEDISDHVEEVNGWKLGERSFRDYYNKAKDPEAGEGDINIKQLEVVNGLCRYLGYDDYRAFCKQQRTSAGGVAKRDGKGPVERTFLHKYKLVLGIAAVGVLLLLTMLPANNQRWMVWEGDHYTEVGFDAEKLGMGSLKLYKEDRIQYFRRIKPDCDTQFFKGNGDENLWYGRNEKGDLEYFTALGKHPQTGTTLKRITKYMIQKHICEEYK